MKKKIYLLGAALMSLALFSCSQETMDTDNATANEAIGFSTLAKGTTRAAATGEMTTAAVNEMAIFGYKQSGGTGDYAQVFNNVIVTYNGTAWEYSPLRYWDKKANYTFYGVMPSSATIDATTNFTITDGTTELVINDIPVAQELNTGYDYMVADGVSRAAGANDVVEFTFNHILSKLNVLAKSAVPTEADATYTVKIKSLTLHMPNGTATYTQNASGVVDTYGDGSATPCDAWTITTTSGTFDFAVSATEKTLTNAYAAYGNQYFVAPTAVTSAGVRTPVNLTMDVTYNVAYANTVDNTKDYDEDFVYTGLAVQDLHYFTQGYVTNLYILFDITAASDNVIKFAVEEVKDWAGTDNNYIDQKGYSFALSTENSSANLAAATADTKVKVTIKAYDTTGADNTITGTLASENITYTFSGTSLTFFEDELGATEITTGFTLATGTSKDVYVNLPVNATGAVKEHTVTVTTNMSDSQTITLYQDKQ